MAYTCFTIYKYSAGNRQIIQSVLLCGAVQKFMLLSVASRLKVKNARLWLLFHSFLQTALHGALWLNKLARLLIALRVKSELPESLQNPTSAYLCNFDSHDYFPSNPLQNCKCTLNLQPFLEGFFLPSFGGLLYPAFFFSARQFIPAHLA